MSTTKQQHLLMVIGAYKDMEKANKEMEQHSLIVTEGLQGNEERPQSIEGKAVSY